LGFSPVLFFHLPASVYKFWEIFDLVTDQSLLNCIFLFRFGGVIPELAQRLHEANIKPVVEQAMTSSGLKYEVRKEFIFIYFW
jgi:hypothetical protein